MDAPQPEPQQASAPEALLHDAAAPGPGLPPLVDSRQSSQAPAEPPQPQHKEGSSDGAKGTHSPASAPSGSSHSTPGPQLFPLPLPPPLSAPVPAPALAPAPLPPLGPVHLPSASSPRPTPVPRPVPTGTPPVAGPYPSHTGHHQQPPPPPGFHSHQPPPHAHHGHQQPPPMNCGYPPLPPPMQQGKVAIVEPPRATPRANGTQFNGLHSPGRDHRANPKFNEDISRLTHAVQQSLPEAVRHVTREHWEKTLLGSDYHQNFVVGLVFFPLFLS